MLSRLSRMSAILIGGLQSCLSFPQAFNLIIKHEMVCWRENKRDNALAMSKTVTVMHGIDSTLLYAPILQFEATISVT